MRKYSKEELLEYFTIIGLDKDEIKMDIENGIKVDNFDNLYKKVSASKKVPDTSLEVSRAYELITAIINNDLFYPTKTSRIEAKKAALETVKDFLDLQYYPFHNFDPKDIFDKTNRLIRTVLLGLAEYESIPRFRLIKENMTPTHAYRIITQNNELANEITKLYGLVGLSKYKNFQINNSIYGPDNNIRKDKVINLLKDYIDSDEPTRIASYKIKETPFDRTSYKQLVKIKNDYMK